MVYSSVPITPSKAKKEVTSITNQIEADAENGTTNDANKKQETPQLSYPPSIFSDKKGNLKFVNIVVRYPCLMILIILALCIGITVNLFNDVFKDGYPFTDDSSTFDLYDKRSLAYDGLRLAKREVAKLREASSPSTTGGQINEEEKNVVRIQERLGDVTYWIYEAKSDKGLFTKDALPIMRSAEVMFTRQKKYPQYCMLKYTKSGNETESECMRELSVLNTFYASSWNSTVAKSIISELTGKNIRLYNSIAACVEFNMLCQYNPSNVTQQDINWAKGMNKRIMSMIVDWDGKGTLNDDPKEVSLLLAHIKELNTKAPYVSFFVDASFNIDNPKTMYSRSIIYWGSPLENADDSSFNSKASSGRMLKK